MVRTLVRLLACLGVVAALGAVPASAGTKSHPDMMLGPGEANVNGIGNEALIRLNQWGFVFIAGKHNTHLTITFDRERQRLRYHDTGTARLTQLPNACDRVKVKVGIAASCRIPAKFADQKMFLQVWPRLGNDFVDGRTLPARFRLWVLADAGRDIVHLGAGNDFVNGAKDGDKVWGNAGNDLLRTGPGNDILYGGPGKDRLVCSENYDTAIRDAGDSMYRCENVRSRG